MFADAYGILHSPDDSSSTHVLADGRYENWYGAVYGGCFLALAFTSAREKAGPDTRGTFFAGRFLRGTQLGSKLTASTAIEKDGRRFLNCTTIVRNGEKTAFVLASDYLKEPECLAREHVSYDAGYRPPSRCDLVLNDRDRPSNPINESFQSLFVGMSQKVRAENLGLHGSTVVGMYTDECFSDGQGCIDPAVFALLTDDAAGVASWSVLSDNVSMNFAMSLFERAPVGAFLACSARARWITDHLSSVAGEFWADGAFVGCCEATFFKDSEWQ